MKTTLWKVDVYSASTGQFLYSNVGSTMLKAAMAMNFNGGWTLVATRMEVLR